MTESPRWFTSSYSNNGGNCIEAAANLVLTRGVVPVRDSKVPSGPVLDFSVISFTAFVSGVKDGEFGSI